MHPAKTTPSDLFWASGWGLHIASHIPIPGAITSNGGTGVADVTISFGPCCESQPWPELYRWDGAVLEFAPPGVAVFRITQDAIIIKPHPAADEAVISGLLVATAMPALLWLRNQFVLHAAGIDLHADGRCVAIAGESGAGKSTLALWLARQGARLVGDDSLAIRWNARTALCAGLAGGVFQGQHNSRHFEIIPPTVGIAQHPVRLHALVILLPAQHVSIRRLQGVEAFEAILQNRHRPAVPLRTGKQQLMMDAASSLSAKTPVFALQFDKQSHSLQELGALIANLIEEDGHINEAIPTE